MENKEKYIADRIREHREDVDLSALWSAVSSDIPTKRKRRGFVWVWLGIGLVGLVVLSTLLMQMQSSKATPIVGVAKDIVVGQQKEEHVPQNATRNHNTLEESQEENPISKADASVKLEKENLEMDMLKSKTTKDRIDRASDESAISVSSISENNTTNYTHSSIVVLQESTDRLEREGGLESQNPNASPTNSQAVVDAALTGIETQEYLSQTAELIHLDYLELLAGEVRYDRAAIKMYTPVLSSMVYLQKAEKKGRFSIAAVAGVAHLDRSLQSLDIEASQMLDRRNSIEEVLGAWYTQVSLHYRLTSGLSVSVGGEIFQAVERATYQSNYLVPGAPATKSIITYLQDGTVAEDEISTTALISRETNEIRINRLTMYQIPLALRYRLPISERIRIDLVGEGALAIAQEYGGYTSFASDEESYNLQEDARALFLKSGTMSYRLGMDLSYAIGGGWAIDGGLRYGRVSGIQSSDNPIAQRYTGYTLQFGLNYKL